LTPTGNQHRTPVDSITGIARMWSKKLIILSTMHY